MVATRNHPKDFPAPPTSAASESPAKRSTRSSTEPNATAASIDSPTKRSTRQSTASFSVAATGIANHVLPTRTSSLPKARPASANSASASWSHTPSNLTLIWLAISLPLVIWDTGYVLLRPWSMPGGWLHKPIWSPYALYGTVDHVYGFKAYEAGTGWTAAQGSFNALETVAYVVYLYLVYTYSHQEAGVQGTGAPDLTTLGRLKALGESRTVHGKVAAAVVLLGYSTAFLTFTKTILYWLIEAFSGFDNIGHNSLINLFFLWIVPNGAWLVFPAYMIYVYGSEILQGLEIASTAATQQGSKKER